MRRTRGKVLAILLSVAAATAAKAQIKVLVDQVGYELHGPKQAFVLGLTDATQVQFELLDDSSGQVVATGPVTNAGSVSDWPVGPVFSIDLSSVQREGHYTLRLRKGTQPIASSCAFAIEENVLERETLSNVVFYFKGQRSSGDFDQADRHLLVPGTAGHPEYVDVHGGWYDATGDYGIHLSHQNLTSFFNPQQVPLVAWTLLSSYGALTARNDDNFSQYRHRLLDEGLYGADFLVRLKRPGGSFFESISAPGKDKLAKDREIGNPNWRTQIKTNANASTEEIHAANGPHAYEASFRAGGGVAIAALALASTMPETGDFSRDVYLQTARDASAFLNEHNRELLNDGRENILDDYCALLAATELFHATQDVSFRAVADKRADSLMSRLATTGQYMDFWRADDGKRPFFHPADAGMPVIALLRYAQITDGNGQARVKEAVRRSLTFELKTTAAVNNPFGYARQLIRLSNGDLRTGFFFPHDTEAAPWWQGEDARLGSLAAAARLAAPMFNDDPAFQRSLEHYGDDQLHWILGRNPYDSSLLMGSGHGNAPYMFFRSYQYTSAPGAILNGVTGANMDGSGIAFNQGFAATGKDEDWRWTEEWLPHAAWFLYAVSLPHATAPSGSNP